MEQRTVQFRCAETGKPFFVLFTRYGPSHNSQVVSVSKTPDAPSGGPEQGASGKADRREEPFDARTLIGQAGFAHTADIRKRSANVENVADTSAANVYVVSRTGLRRLPAMMVVAEAA